MSVPNNVGSLLFAATLLPFRYVTFVSLIPVPVCPSVDCGPVPGCPGAGRLPVCLCARDLAVCPCARVPVAVPVDCSYARVPVRPCARRPVRRPISHFLENICTKKIQTSDAARSPFRSGFGSPWLLRLFSQCVTATGETTWHPKIT